jgi:hypothetical protein
MVWNFLEEKDYGRGSEWWLWFVLIGTKKSRLKLIEATFGYSVIKFKAYLKAINSTLLFR